MPAVASSSVPLIESKTVIASAESPAPPGDGGLDPRLGAALDLGPGLIDRAR